MLTGVSTAPTSQAFHSCRNKQARESIHPIESGVEIRVHYGRYSFIFVALCYDDYASSCASGVARGGFSLLVIRVVKVNKMIYYVSFGSRLIVSLETKLVCSSSCFPINSRRSYWYAS